jgi:hypothetical protein
VRIDKFQFMTYMIRTANEKLQIKRTVIINEYQQDATILAYLFIPNQLYMFRAMSSPIIRST